MKRWPEIRGGLLAIVILFGLVEGCPLPPPDDTPDWERGFVDAVRTVQRVVLRPVAWIEPRLRISQRWALYQAPSRERFRLWVEGQDMRGRWQVLFRAGDDAHQHDGELIDYSRPRGVWAPNLRLPGQYPAFARWMTWRVLEHHPDWVAARVRLEKVRITDDGLAPSNEFIGVHMRTRGGPP